MSVVVLPARLDTTAASALWAELSALLGQEIRLDASPVEHLGARCLEVLLTIRHLALSTGSSVAVEAISEAAIADLRTFGLSPDDISSGDAS